MLTEEDQQSQASFAGSVGIFEAECIDSVKEAIYEDVYYVNCVVRQIYFLQLSS
jgi:hypothetical protein